MVAGKNLKRAEEAAGSFSARTLGAPLRPTPSAVKRKINPLAPPPRLAHRLSRFALSGEVSPPDPLSHLSPQRGILRSELRNKERRLFVLFRSRSICVDSQLLLNSSISYHSLHSRHVLIPSFKGSSLYPCGTKYFSNVAATLLNCY